MALGNIGQAGSLHLFKAVDIVIILVNVYLLHRRERQAGQIICAVHVHLSHRDCKMHKPQDDDGDSQRDENCADLGLGLIVLPRRQLAAPFYMFNQLFR